MQQRHLVGCWHRCSHYRLSVACLLCLYLIGNGRTTVKDILRMAFTGLMPLAKSSGVNMEFISTTTTHMSVIHPIPSSGPTAFGTLATGSSHQTSFITGDLLCLSGVE